MLTEQLVDPHPSPVMAHSYVMESKNAHPVLDGVPKQLWATHKYDVSLIKDATPLVVVLKLAQQATVSSET